MRLFSVLLAAALILLGPSFGEAAAKEAARQNIFGVELANQGKLEEAFLAFQQAVRLDPSYAEAQLNLAFALDRLNRADEAIAAYKKGIAMDPRNATALNNLGVLYDKKGLYDEAISAYEQALGVDPANPSALKNLETAKKNRTAIADRDAQIAEAKKQVDARPRDPQAAYNLGRVYASFGKNDEALQWLAKAMELGFDDIGFLKADPALGSLRMDPRFVALLRGR